VPGQPTTLQSREAGCQAGSAAWVRACGGEGEQGIGAAGSGRKQRSGGRVTGEQVCATPRTFFHTIVSGSWGPSDLNSMVQKCATD
jgi:hypothetical protein